MNFWLKNFRVRTLFVEIVFILKSHSFVFHETKSQNLSSDMLTEQFILVKEFELGFVKSYDL